MFIVDFLSENADPFELRFFSEAYAIDFLKQAGYKSTEDPKVFKNDNPVVPETAQIIEVPDVQSDQPA